MLGGKKKIQFNLEEDKEFATKYSQSKFINQGDQSFKIFKILKIIFFPESSEIPYFSKYNFNKDQQSSKPILSFSFYKKTKLTF